MSHEMSNARQLTLTYSTQDYVSRQHGDDRIDCYVTLPSSGIRDTTGLLLLIHGWGNDGSVAYEGESLDFSDRFDLVVTRVEYRDCGREAHHPEPGKTFDRPYDFSLLQAIDSLRAAWATLARFPELNRRRLFLWGGSQGGHIAAQCLIFAPGAWAGAVLCSGLYRAMTYEQTVAGGYAYDMVHYPGYGFVDYALGQGKTYLHQHQLDIRDSIRNAHLMPDGVPIVLIHGTRDDNVDIRHAVELHARLSNHGKDSRFFAIAEGDHGLFGAENPALASRAKCTLLFASGVLSGRREQPGTLLATPTAIPVTGGIYEVSLDEGGPSLRFVEEP
jgi:predicted esterase